VTILMWENSKIHVGRVHDTKSLATYQTLGFVVMNCYSHQSLA